MGYEQVNFFPGNEQLIVDFAPMTVIYNISRLAALRYF